MKIKAVVFLIAIILLELLIRIVFSAIMGVPLFTPKEIIYRYYPMVKEIKEKYNKSDSSDVKVLILSCSTLHKEWGDFEKQLEDSLNINAHVSIKYSVFSAAGIGFSSADFLNCYHQLDKLKFDYVIDYGGINDARLNNCPPSIFKNDYSHINWNNEVNCIMRHPEMNYFVSPFVFDYCCQLIRQGLFNMDFIPRHYSLRLNWWQYGEDFKSLRSFRNNTEEIIRLSSRKKEDLLLVSYCYFLPNNYSLEKFKTKKLSYRFEPNSRETEIWGRPKNVTGFIDSCNKMVSELQGKNVYFFDANSNFSIGNHYFADVCHFSKEGMEAFTSLISKQILSIEERKYEYQRFN